MSSGKKSNSSTSRVEVYVYDGNPSILGFFGNTIKGTFEMLKHTLIGAAFGALVAIASPVVAQVTAPEPEPVVEVVEEATWKDALKDKVSDATTVVKDTAVGAKEAVVEKYSGAKEALGTLLNKDEKLQAMQKELERTNFELAQCQSQQRITEIDNSAKHTEMTYKAMDVMQYLLEVHYDNGGEPLPKLSK